MSIMGVLIGLMLFRMPFGIINTGVGIISLAGIVVNNAIILIDYIDILRERDGMNRREALVQGGKTRLRPVVLTALTTALGMVPVTLILSYAGSQLGQVESFSMAAIFTPGMILSLCLLATFPFLAKAIVKLAQRYANR